MHLASRNAYCIEQLYGMHVLSVMKIAVFRRCVQVANACHNLSVGRELGRMTLICAKIAQLLCMSDPGSAAFGLPRLLFTFPLD